MPLQKLIERAAEKTGSRYQIAKQLGVSANLVNDWYKGRVPCQPADQARIADLAGENAVDALVEATLEKHEGTPRGEQLKAALKKWSAQAGAVSGSGLAGVLVTLGVGRLVSLLADIPRCIKSKAGIHENTGFTGDELADLG